MANPRLTWSRTAHSGKVQMSLSGNNIPGQDTVTGHAGYDNGAYTATALIGDQRVSSRSGTLHSAVRRVNDEIDRRSIGLLNADIVEFIVA